MEGDFRRNGMNILVSACLLGVNCRYSGKGELCQELQKLMKEHRLIPVCPEQLGGLATPRTPAERVKDRVVTQMGEDVTAQYEKGARETAGLAELFGCRCAVLKERSPSCGNGRIYDGTFSRQLVSGDGTAAALLKERGVRIFGETEIEKLKQYLEGTGS